MKPINPAEAARRVAIVKVVGLVFGCLAIAAILGLSGQHRAAELVASLTALVMPIGLVYVNRRATKELDLLLVYEASTIAIVLLFIGTRIYGALWETPGRALPAARPFALSFSILGAWGVGYLVAWLRRR